MSSRSWPMRLWMKLHEPRIVTAAQTVIYLLCALAGLLTILEPPRSIEVVYGPWTTFTWGTFALIGGVLGMYATPTGKWLIEKPAIIACSTAMVLYAGFIISLQLTSAGNRLVQLCFVLIVLVHFIGRYGRIRPYSYEPGK